MHIAIGLLYIEHFSSIWFSPLSMMRKVTNNGKLIIQLVQTRRFFSIQSGRLIFHSTFINRELIDTFNQNVFGT